MKFITYYPCFKVRSAASRRDVYAHCFWLVRWAHQRLEKKDNRSLVIALQAINSWMESNPVEMAFAVRSYYEREG